MLKYYKVPVLLIEFNPERVRCISCCVFGCIGRVPLGCRINAYFQVSQMTFE